MAYIEKLFSKYWFLVILVLIIPAVKALFVPGFYGADDDLHIAWLHQMDKVLREGQIPPRFVPDLSFGFGYPLFNFVFPLPFYLGEIFHLLGLSFTDSIKAVFLLSIPLSAFSMYFLLKKYLSTYLCLAGAVLYVYTPYRATDIYIRGAIGEVLSFVFLPIIILAVLKVTDFSPSSDSHRTKDYYRWVGIGGLSIACLILTHNITAFMFIPAAFLLGLLRIIFNKPKILKTWGQFVMMILLGMVSSVYFWLPALMDSSLMKYDTVFNPVDHFPTIKQLLTPYFGYGPSIPGPYDGMSFFLGTINLSVICLGILSSILFWNKISKERKIIFIWLAMSLIAIFGIMNYRSAFLWQNLPLLPYFQFPWRFLILTTFLSPLFLIILPQEKILKFFPLLIIFSSIFLNALYFKPHDFLGRGDNYYLNRYIPMPIASEDYKSTQEEYLRLPKNTLKRPEENFPRAYAMMGGITQIENKNSLDARINTKGDTFLLNYSKYYFPGWEAQIDGQKATVTAGYPYGQIVVLVPEGEHKVDIRFKEPITKRVLDVISLAGILVSLVLVANTSLSFPRRRKSI